ncbi:hypothetical protein [Variovorax atrisoli]|uniref:hypothetical protein n=1 Tax=Variovorax atrisoli TaxID=3394203 RepID=UPI0016166023|nr:hypothetical protein [Variovorax sp. BK613]MBB3639791.1 hypothetical protein [Variovorax sp. BK613]
MVAALSAPVVNVAQLVLMDFGGGLVIALNSRNHDIEWGGVVYRGAAGLGTISPIDDSPGEVKGLQLQMSGVPVEYLSMALDDAAVVQGARLVVRLAVLNDAGAVVDAPIDWDGYMDTTPIETDGVTCTITATAESSAVDFLRGNPRTTSNADQQAMYPGDRAMEFIVSQDGVPIVWPTKQYYIDSR